MSGTSMAQTKQTARSNDKPKTHEELSQALEDGIRGVLGSEDFKNFLATAGRHFCNQYSFRNAMLVWLQKPEASYCMGYESWKSVGRQVRQGAEGARIVMPAMAGESEKGGLYAQVTKALNAGLKNDKTTDFSSYRVGASNLEFVKLRSNGLVGFKTGGKERGFFKSEDSMKRYIDYHVLGKIPARYSVVAVFDEQDTIAPEHLWLKSGFTADEIARDKDGSPIVNSKGETKIINTPERQARFRPTSEAEIAERSPEHMITLFEAARAVSGRMGVPVYKIDGAADNELESGAKGYYTRETSPERPNGFIVIDKDLSPTESCAVLLHEMAHSRLHNESALAIAAGDGVVTRALKETQAEAAAYMTAAQFGIETDASTFEYIATYAKGAELQDLQNSLNVIFNESKRLTDEIAAELDTRGFNMDLTPKEGAALTTGTIESLARRFRAEIAQKEASSEALVTTLSSLYEKYRGDSGVTPILENYRQVLAKYVEEVTRLKGGVPALREALSSRDAANSLERALARLDGYERKQGLTVGAMERLAYERSAEAAMERFAGHTAKEWDGLIEEAQKTERGGKDGRDREEAMTDGHRTVHSNNDKERADNI